MSGTGANSSRFALDKPEMQDRGWVARAMREVLPELMRWYAAGDDVAMATVVATYHSAPRLAGAAMLRGPDDSAVGSVSGGCVEGAVFDLAEAVLSSGTPVLHRFGVSDEDAASVGLTCGGILDIFIERINRSDYPELAGIDEDVAAGRPVAIATVIEHENDEWLGRRLVVRPQNLAEGNLGSARANDAVFDDAVGLLAQGRSATLSYGTDGERRGEGMRVFVSSFAPAPRMLVFGAIDFAAAVSRIGSFLGYRVTLCDARKVFATATRFPDVDEVVVDWPHRYLVNERDAGRVDARTVICVVTHDPKFDVPLLEVALRLPEVAYVGAMGSRRTHHDRLARLTDAGLTPAELARLCSPIGLDLGARTPEETAVSIAAEIIASQWHGSGSRLRDTTGRIHDPGAPDAPRFRPPPSGIGRATPPRRATASGHTQSSQQMR